MTKTEAADLVRSYTADLVTDPESDVVYAGAYEGRWAVRMRQQVRDFTTIWFEFGDLTVGYEAYVLPAPTVDRGDAFRYMLSRNYRAWRGFFAIDRDGDIYVRGRIPLSELSDATIDQAIGAVYEMIEISFAALLRLGFR